MPYPNEHAARLQSPTMQKIRVRRTKGEGKVHGVSVPAGVSVIWYITKKEGKEVSIPQAIRFPATSWTSEKAKSWLKKNKIFSKVFEPATGKGNKKDSDDVSIRYDKGQIRNSHFTPEGFLKADVVITRTGVFLYRNADGSLRRELRHPDEVLKQDSLRTMEMLPVTLFHPSEGEVNADNAKQLSVGFTGESVKVDGKNIKNSILITDQDAIDAVVGGVQELSLGYNIVRDWTSGKYDNEEYDLKQTEIEYNHLALVPKARAGGEARIVLNGDDAIQCVRPSDGQCIGNCFACQYSLDYAGNIEYEYDESLNTDNDDTNHNHNKEKRMKKIVLDGIEYDAAPEVINAYNKENARADKAEAELKTANDEKSSVQAKLDEANAKIKKHDDENNDEKIKKAVDTRLDLVSKATPHLDEETVKKIADMSDKDIKISVIKAHYPDANLDDKDDAYINARFDGAIELPSETDNQQNRSDAMSQQRKKVSDTDKGNDKNKNLDAKKSRDNMIKDMQDAWKTPESKTGTDE